MIPADVVAATPTWQFISQGSYENYNASAANYQTWKGWGIGGHVFRLGAAGDNMTQIGQGTTTANVLDDPHKWQHAMEGYAYNGINTTNPTSNVQQNMGIKIAHDTDPSIELWMWIQLMLPGDPWDDAAWSAWATFMAGRAACLKFFGGTGFFTDTERPGKGNGTTQFSQGVCWDVNAQPTSPGHIVNPADTGHTFSQMCTQMEARGYQVGQQIYAAFPDISIGYYDTIPTGSWVNMNVYPQTDGTTTTPQVLPDPGTGYRGGYDGCTQNAYNPKMQLLLGMLRAGMEANTKGTFTFVDHRLGYYLGAAATGNSSVDYQTAWKWSNHYILAHFSQELSQPMRDFWMSKLHNTFNTWGNAESVSTFSQQNEVSEAGYNTQLTYARKWATSTRMFNFQNWPRPDGITPAGTGLWSGQCPYTYPTTRIPAMQTLASQTQNVDSTPITVGTIGQARSGTTVTLTFSCSHVIGIHHVHWTLYASDGNTIAGQGEAVMTVNLNGATTTTPIASFNPSMDCTVTVPNAIAGLYVILDVYSIKDQRTSRLVQVT